MYCNVCDGMLRPKKWSWFSSSVVYNKLLLVIIVERQLEECQQVVDGMQEIRHNIEDVRSDLEDVSESLNSTIEALRLMQIDNEKLRTYTVSEIESILMDMKVNNLLLRFFIRSKYSQFFKWTQNVSSNKKRNTLLSKLRCIVSLKSNIFKPDATSSKGEKCSCDEGLTALWINEWQNNLSLSKIVLMEKEVITIYSNCVWHHLWMILYSFQSLKKSPHHHQRPRIVSSENEEDESKEMALIKEVKSLHGKLIDELVRKVKILKML